MKVTRKSPLTGIHTTLDLPVTGEQMHELGQANRRKIQDIFPELSQDQREFLLSGYTQEDWDKMFPPEPEEEQPQPKDDGWRETE